MDQETYITAQVHRRRHIYIALAIIALIAAVFIKPKKLAHAPLAPETDTEKIEATMQPLPRAHVLSIGGSTDIVLEIADSPAEREKGLMFRESLPANVGMLFVFDTDTGGAFWMKNTLIPLDILFIDANKKIVDLTTMDPCINDPCAQYPSRTPYRYAIEVNQGFIRDHKIKIGDMLEFE